MTQCYEEIRDLMGTFAVSPPPEPCDHCGALVWEMAEQSAILSSVRISWPIYRCRECAHDAPYVTTAMVGA